MDPPPSWSRRVINATPPMPDGLWGGLVLCMVFLLGVGVGLRAGLLWCTWEAVDKVNRPSVQQQRDALDKRLRTLEHR